MQTVRQLNDDDPDVLRHCKKHVPQILRLHFQLQWRLILKGIILWKLQVLQFGDAVYQECHVRSELFAYVFQRKGRILDDIMKEPRRDGFLIHLEVRQDDGHAERMNDIRLSRLSKLFPMRFGRSQISLVDQTDIIGRMVFMHAFNQIPV